MIINKLYDLKKEQDYRNSLYSNIDRSFKEKYQIKKINDQWIYLIKNISFYKFYKDKFDLPDNIKNFTILQQFPIINKEFINENYHIILKDYKNHKFTLTGGTSGMTMKFPTNFFNSKNNFNNQIYLRNKFNINYNDKCLYIWGHSHKFSNNYLKKNVQHFNKYIKNYLFNRIYISSYELNEEILDKIVQIIRINKPKYLITYSSTISILINFIASNQLIVNNDIKIITTSENLPKENFEIFKKIFPNGILINEFGMAETGVIGYNCPNKNYYEIFNLWHNFVLQAVNSELIITEISKKAFPLFRYRPDDKINIVESENLFEFIPKGKDRPIFDIIGENYKVQISSIKFDHIIKNFNKIISCQYYYSDNYLSILLYSNHLLNKDKILKKIDQEINFKSKNIKIFKINKPIKNISGKFKYLIKKDDFNKAKLG